MAKSRARKLADIIVGAGVDIDGNLTFDGGSTSEDLTFADGDKANFGDASDLQIYHSGADSLIVDSGTGGLYLRGSNFISLQNAAGSETMIYAGNDGAVQLKYDNSTKLATTSSGVSVTGSVSANSGTTNTVATFTSTDAGAGINLTDNSGTSTLQTNGANLRIGVDEDGAVSSSAIQFRVDGSTKATLNSSGNLGIGTSSPSEKLHIHAGGIYSTPVTYASNQDNWALKLGASNNSGWDYMGIKLRVNSGGIPRMSFHSASSAEVMSVVAGKVGIGTTAPTKTLHVDGVIGSQNSSQGTGFLELQGYGNTAFINHSGSSNLYFRMGSGYNTRMTLTSGGNLGIGTTSPTSILHILGSSAKTRIQDSSNNYALDLQMSSSIGKISTSADMALRPGGVESVRLKSDGKVGIGTTAPANRLHVKAGASGASTFDARYNLVLEDDGENYIGFYVPNNSFAGIRFVNASSSLRGYIDYYHGSQGDKMHLYAQNSIQFDFPTTGTAAIIKQDGKVGIGTTNPIYKLHVAGTSYFSGGIQLDSTDKITIGNPNQFITAVNDTSLTLATDGSASLTILDNGSVGIGTTSPSEKLEVNAGNIRITNATGGSYFKAVQTTNGANAGYYMASGSSNWYTLVDTAGRYQIYDGDAVAIRVLVDGSGNVGIAKTNPGTKLDVAGDIRALEAIYSEGSAPRVQLQDTDGTNQFSFFQQSSSQLSLRLRNDSADGSFRIAGYGGTTTTDRMIIGSTGDFTFYQDDGSTEALFIDASNGRVGIGTTSPLFQFHVDSGATDVTGYFKSSDNKAAILIADDDTNTYVSAENSVSSFGSNPGINANNLNVTSAGRVGIGVTSPSAIVEIKDASASAPGTALKVHSVQNSAAADGLVFIHSEQSLAPFTALNVRQDGNGDILNLLDGTTEVFTVVNGGNVGIGTTSPDTLLHVSATSPHIDIGPQGGNRGKIGYHDLDVYIGSTSSTGEIHFKNNIGSTDAPHSSGDTKMVITDSNVGIGTTSPYYKFDVYGEDDVTMRIHRPNSGLATTDTVGIGFSQRGDANTSTSDTRAGIFSTYNGDLFLAVEAGGNLNSNPFDHSALFIEGTNGYVGIGTTSPSTPLQISYNGGHTSGTVALANSAFDIYNPLEANTNEKGSILTFSDNYYSSGGNTYHRTTRAAIKGGTDNAGNTADGFLAFYTDAAGANSMPERMRIDHDGSAIINSTSPLLVGGTARLSIYDSSVILSGGLSGSDMFYIRKQGTAAFAWQTYNGNNGGQIELQPYGGSVGIGTTSPTGAKLHVAGGIKATDLIAHDSTGINLQTSNGSKRLLIDDGNGNATFQANNHTNLQVKSGDNSTVAFLQTVQGSDVRFGTSSNHQLNLATNGTFRLSITNGGQIGMGTSNIDTTASVEIGNAAPATGVTTLRLTNAVNNKGQRIDFEDDNGARAFTLSHDNGSNITYMGNLLDEDFAFYAGNAERLRLTYGGAIHCKESGNNGDYTMYIGSVNPGGSGARYAHVQINTDGSEMFWVEAIGYDYIQGGSIYGRAGGYVYNYANQTSVYSNSKHGDIVELYQNTSGRVEIVIDLTATQTNNRWGSVVLRGGCDTITTSAPLEIIQYSYTSTTAKVY